MCPSRAVVIVGVSHKELPRTECESVWIAQSFLKDHFTLGSIQVGLDNLWLPAPVAIEQKPEQWKTVLTRWKTVKQMENCKQVKNCVKQVDDWVKQGRKLRQPKNCLLLAMVSVKKTKTKNKQKQTQKNTSI